MIALHDMLDRIVRAFSNVPYPKGPLVVETLDDEGVEDRYSGTHWREHLETGRFRPWDMWFLSPPAFVYFLPLYLLAALENRASNAEIIRGHLLAQFNPSPTSNDSARAMAIVSLLNSEQCKLISGILDYLHTKYWPVESEIADVAHLRAITMLKGLGRQKGTGPNGT